MKHLPLLLLLTAGLLLGACTTVPVTPAKKGMTLETQQEALERAKQLFLSKQYAEAAALLLPLAQQGNLEAQYTLGYMYHYGLGLPRNEREATRWIAVAAARGHPKAKEALKRIEAQRQQTPQ
jgi:TPR repeat protein